jgi:murein L,D-transpeptidase YcbB/YkuD
MHSVRFGILAGTALALILTASTIASAAPQDSEAFVAPQPLSRDYSTPGSMPKPSVSVDDSVNFRGSLRPDVQAVPPEARASASPADLPTPRAVTPALAPAPAPTATPVVKAAPVPTSGPTPERITRPVAAPASVPPPERITRPAAAPAKPASAEPAVVAAPNAATESEVGQKIREIIAGRSFERLVSRKPDREAIAALYQKVRNFQPLWASQGAPSERARDALDYLKTIDADGLDPKDYPMPRLNVGSAEAQAEAELKFTATLLTYARHAMTGRVHFTRVSPNIDYKLAFDPGHVLQSVASSNDLPKTLAQFNPLQPGYRALKAKLAEMRETADDTTEHRIPSGAVLRYSRDRRGHETVMTDPRVPALRERLDLPAEPNSNYDAPLAMAVGKFQKANSIQVSGQLTAPTIEALNGPSRAKRMDAILATMERWRWMPRDLGRTHVELNIPDFFIRVYHDGEKVWQTRTVVGKPGHETPLLTETMKFITMNPTWNVPQSIIYNELLPLYETTDPQIFERQGMKMERERDGSVRVFQPPGERNALGRIRFNFPNKFLVYQHDTPEKHYFDAEKRAYSHGCQRVQNPLKYAEVLLSYASPKAGYTVDRLQHMLGGEEKQIDFVNQIPVHLMYQTAFVDEAGKLQFRDDIYGLDSKLMSILRGSDRQVADVAIEQPADPNFKPTAAQGAKLRQAAGGRTPFALFEHLFR